MGLDMYLNAKRYISKNFNKGDEAVAAAIQAQFPELAGKAGRWGDDSPVKEVTIEAGYWRKANAIHQWFVKNVQEGKDDCRTYEVYREQLEELRELCKRVLAFRHLAVELLPAQAGFFFGSTDYDDYYFDDLEQTVAIIDDVLTLPTSWDFEYRASW
jgi:hypothetical protein